MSAIIVKSFVGQAERYFEKELTNERETYYSEKGASVGQWTGKGAEALSLTGAIKKEDFSKISRGIDPTTGERFRRMTLGRTREINGEIKQVKEIAGWDMVISAPKSVSIAGLIGQDERVRQAHEEAVTDTLDRAERQAQSNNGGGKKEQTSNLIVARFQHDSARPSKDGFVAPQLHDHCFIMNATLRADGTLKPLESLELHKAQSYIRSVYYTGLADRLQKLGYAIEIDRETGAPEITGISKQYRQACSPRRAEILELAEKAGKNFRQLGLVNRREKIFDKDLIQEQHKGIDGLFDYQAQRVVETARKTPTPTEKPDLAKEAVTFALAKLSERESVFNPRVVLLEANKRGIGQTSVTAIEAEMETRKKDGQVKTVSLSDGREAAFLSSDAQIENKLPQHLDSLKPKQTLGREITQLNRRASPSERAEFESLSDEQQSAVKEILTAKTGVVTLEGRAGVGKTTTLSFVNKIAEKADYEVLGLAPTTGAAQELDNAKITSSTLQKLLASQDAPRDHKRFFIVDESSFVSSRQMDKFFREAVKPNDRVLLVGDTRQHEGVEAGKPFARIQRDELAAGAKVETVRRQTKETMRETVKKLSEGKIIEAVGEMRERGQVREVKDRDERHNSIVEAFLDKPEKSLVVAPRNADRQQINSKIHTALKDAGKVGEQETEIKVLRPRSELGGVEREFAAAYREGDVITYTRGSKENQIPAKSLARVVKTDREQNLLTVEIKDGTDGKEAREVTYNPKRLRGVSVWTEEKIKVSEGDRLQLRAPFEEKQTKIANGTMLEVGKITPDALTLTTDKGKALKLDADQPHAIDYGYAVTSHSSQGKTIDRVLIHAETSESKQILNERMAYVAVSRARNEALIFTDDAEKLAFKMARQIEKTEITQTKAETVEHAPERAEKIVFDAKPEFEKAERGEIKQPVISPTVEKLLTPEIKIEPTREKVVPTSDKRSNRQETLIKEVLQMSRDSLAKQGIERDPQAWTRYANDIANDAPNQKAPVSQIIHLKWMQRSMPVSERVNLETASRLETTHLILKLSPEISQKQFVENRLDRYEREIATERNEIKPPVVLPGVEKPPTRKIEIELTQAKTIVSDVKPELEKVDRSEEIKIESAQEKPVVLDAKPDAERSEIKSPAILPEASSLPTLEIEIEPERAEKIVFDAKPEFEKAERGEIKQPVISPTVEKLPTPEIKTQPAQEKTIAADVKPELAPVEREEIKSPVFLSAAETLAKPEITIETTPEKSIVVDTKPEVEKVESSEIKPPVILPAVEDLPTAEIKIEPTPEKTTVSDAQPEVAKADGSEIKQPVNLPTVEKSATPTIEIQPTPEKTIVLDAKPELAKAEQKETEQPRQPAAEKLPTPTIEIEPAQRESISLDAKPEVARTEREEIEIEPARKETVVLDAKPEVERGEVKPPVILPEATILPTAEIKAQPPPQQKTIGNAGDAKYSQETLIKEVLQISRNSLAKQGINPDPQAWRRFASVIINDSPNRKPSENQERILESLQKDAPQPERVNLAGKTSLEATHAILTSAPEKRRDEIVKGTLARYEKEVAAERGEIKQPVILSSAQTLPTPDIKPQQLREKTADSTRDAKNRREILIREVLQMSRSSLAEQGINPDPQVWKRFAVDIINNWANQESTEGHRKALESLQKDVPQSERLDSAGGSRLEAAHAMLKLATEEQRDEIVKNTLANYERQIKTERGEAVAKPEVKETAETTSLKTTSFEKAEKAAVEQVKLTPKVRDLEVAGREKLISELVAAARDEAKAWTSEELSYRHEKRLTKMYREVGDFEPHEKQINDLKAIEERLSEPLPQPKTFLEATVLKFDNITGAEKSAALRGQITSLNEIVKREEAEKAEKAEKAGTLKTFGQTESNDAFGRTDEYFIRESYRAGINPEGRTSFSLMNEAYDRGLIVENETLEPSQQKRIQTGLHQMGIANALQEQVKKSLDEQGIKLEPSAQRIINNMVDGLLKQPLTDNLFKKVEEINRSRGIGITPETTLEAIACIYTHSDEEKRDKWSSALASAASQKADETRMPERIKSKEVEHLRVENKTQFFSR